MARGSLVVLNQRKNIDSRQFRAAIQKTQFQREGRPNYLSAKLAHERGSGGGRATRGQQVIADEHFLPGPHGILMDLESIRAVLELILNARGFPRQFPRFSHGNKTGAEPVRQRRSENKATRFHADHHVHGLAGVMRAKLVHNRAKAGSVLQQGRQVVEENSRLRVIRDLANQSF